MTDSDALLLELQEIIEARLGERVKDYLYPPPIFTAMQGGMIAAAVDNTLGPLSVAVAPPNVTRTLEMKYSRPIGLEMGFIVVQASLVERSDPQLVFRAKVCDPEGKKLATCRAVHWILAERGEGEK